MRRELVDHLPGLERRGLPHPPEGTANCPRRPERKVLQRPSNICFGWEERKTAFIGSLDGTTIPYFQVPTPGARLIHQKP